MIYDFFEADRIYVRISPIDLTGSGISALTTTARIDAIMGSTKVVAPAAVEGPAAIGGTFAEWGLTPGLWSVQAYSDDLKDTVAELKIRIHASAGPRPAP